MQVYKLEFGSLLAYCPRGSSEKTEHSRNVMRALKGDKHVENPPIVMSEWIAKKLKQKMTELPFKHFFQPNMILVPCPKSSLMQPNSLWIPERIASAFVSEGLGKQVSSCLIRSKAVPKAALSSSSQRPAAKQHYDTITVQNILRKPEDILLVDDIVTRGALFMGCANRLAHAFPDCRIKAFAAMRTISDQDDFQNVYSPCTGFIDLLETGDTCRMP